MAYFRHHTQEQAHEPAFRAPVNPDSDAEEDANAFPEDEEEAEERRRGYLRVAAGIGDFLGVVAGAVAILLLVAMLISLTDWVHADLVQSFDLWQLR